MEDWGGAQWLMIFLFAIRAFIGLAKMMGKIVIPESSTPSGKAGEYVGNRLADLILVAILIWGGFF